MCGVKPEEVPVTAEAVKRGLGKKDKFDIIKKYSESNETEFKNFKIPLRSLIRMKIPVWLLDFVPHIDIHRPVVKKNSCIQCGKCRQVSPAGAIDFNAAGYPEFDMPKCIKCFCSDERCPESAIIEKTNFIASFLHNFYSETILW